MKRYKKKAKKRRYELRRIRRLSLRKPRKKKRKIILYKKDNAKDSNIDFQLKAPHDFRLLKNTWECICFFKKVRSQKYAVINSSGIKEVRIDLSGVVHIDFAATMMLDAICDELANNGNPCNVFGNTPKRTECMEYLKESGFLSSKHDAKTGRLFAKQLTSDNMKIERGHVKLLDSDVQRVVEIEKHICKHLTGNEGRNFKHIDIIKEICGNTVDWSGAVRNQWSYGVKLEEGKAIIVALDLGQGILETLCRKFSLLLGDLVSVHSHLEILRGAYNKKYGSRSGRINRNKGLPLLRNSNEKCVIKNLTVITNNVILDFSNPENSKKFFWNKNKAFSGTLYSWVIDASCF